MLQTLEELSGLPLFIDEAHTARDPRDLEALVYQFANGEAYTRGGVDGKTRGGEPLGGAVLLADEALPEFRHAGSHGRVFWIDVGRFPPLGCEPKSDEGARRAERLEHAWTTGAGLLGRDIAQVIWDDWPSFTANVDKLQALDVLKPLNAWRAPLALAYATLDVVFTRLELEPPPSMAGLLEVWVEMLMASHAQTEPAAEAWEQLVTMLAQAEHDVDGEWYVAKLQHQLVACRHKHEVTWRVLTQTQKLRIASVAQRCTCTAGPGSKTGGWCRTPTVIPPITCG
jgi:hypothetical protein